ncbi:MAG: type II secretion system minor pseudopilin GspI [Sulfuriferula sp.]
MVNKRRNLSGFTLFEVMIALAIVAIALAAAMRAANLGTDSAIELKTRTLAAWVAQNRMAEHIALSDWPGIGAYTGIETQAGMDFVWQEKVTSTPSVAFRRIEIDVFSKSDAQHRLNRLIGYLLSPSVLK